MKTYEELKKELKQEYPMISPYHYWIISSRLTYPAMSIYNDESTRVFKHDVEPDMARFNGINFEDCRVYQCDGMGGTDVDTEEDVHYSKQGYALSEYVDIPELDVKTWKVQFVFDCTQYGSIYRTVTCSEDNFFNAVKHEAMLARIQRDLYYDEPWVILKKEEVSQ